MCVHALLGPQRDTEVPKGQACATDMPDISHGCMLSCFSCIRLFETLWTVVCQAPLSMGFSRQEYWSGVPSPSPERNYGFLSDQLLNSLLSTSVAISLKLINSDNNCETLHWRIQDF